MARLGPGVSLEAARGEADRLELSWSKAFRRRTREWLRRLPASGRPGARRVSGAVDAPGCCRLRAAHRLRKSGESAAGPRGEPRARARGARGPGGKPRTDRGAAARGKRAARRDRWHARPPRRVCRDGVPRLPRSGGHASDPRGGARRPRPRFAGLSSLLAGILFGLAPSLRSARTDLRGALSEAGREGGSSPRRGTLRSWLVAGQVALAMVLLVGCGPSSSGASDS